MSEVDSQKIERAANDIAAQLGISYNEVRYHLERALIAPSFAPVLRPMSRFARFWVWFWYRVGWQQRAQWIILQNLKAAK